MFLEYPVVGTNLISAMEASLIVRWFPLLMLLLQMVVGPRAPR